MWAARRRSTGSRSEGAQPISSGGSQRCSAAQGTTLRALSTERVIRVRKGSWPEFPTEGLLSGRYSHIHAYLGLCLFSAHRTKAQARSNRQPRLLHRRTNTLLPPSPLGACADHLMIAPRRVCAPYALKLTYCAPYALKLTCTSCTQGHLLCTSCTHLSLSLRPARRELATACLLYTSPSPRD